MGRLGATDAAPAQLLQLKFQGLAWGPWAGSFSPSPTFSAIKCRRGGACSQPHSGGGQDPSGSFSALWETECSRGPTCLGFVCLQTAFSPGVWWVTFPSPSPRKKNKQLRAGGYSCETFSKIEKGEKKQLFQSKRLVKSKAVGCRKEWECLHHPLCYQENFKIHPREFMVFTVLYDMLQGYVLWICLYNVC